MKQLETNKVNKRIWEILIFGKIKKDFKEVVIINVLFQTKISTE